MAASPKPLVSPLKKPTLVYLMAGAFLVAPFGNILLSLAALGVEGWYTPHRLGQFLPLIPFLDWLWFAFVFVSGVFLLRPHRLTWGFSLGTLVLVLAIQIYKALLVRHNTTVVQDVHFYGATLTTLAVFILCYHFRFPYLDRRANWWKNLPRYEVDAEVTFFGFEGLKGRLKNVSESGLFVTLEATDLAKMPESGNLTVVLPLQKPLEVTVEVQGKRGGGLALGFVSESKGAMGFQDWVRSLKT